MSAQSLTGRIANAHALQALYSANFRLLLAGSLVSSFARWGGVIVFAWLTLELTGSEFKTGLVIAVRSAGYLISPVAGIIADRYSRRTIMMLVGVFSVAYMSVLALLITSDTLVFWHLVSISAVSSLTHAFDNPIRKTLSADLVEAKYLTSAYALTVVATDTTAIIGPALAGGLLDITGAGGVAWMMAIVYVLNILTFFKMKLPPTVSKEAKVSPYRNLADGVKYIRGYQAILGLMLLAVLGNGLPMVGMSTLTTIFAKNVFDVGGTGLGLLLGFSGAGGLLGALAVVFLGNIKHKAKANVATGVGMGIAAILLALSPVLPVALPIMVLYGFNSAVFLTLGNALLLELTPTNMRGRVMGVRGLALAAHLPGALFVGGMAEVFGARGASALVGVSCIALMIGVAVLLPALLRSDVQSRDELAEAAGGELAAEPVRAH
jgi:MFS family permease